MYKENWIIPFKGKNVSLYYNLNFLWRKNQIYVMDNHRAAMWCWIKEMVNHKKYNLFHIDRHFDTLYSNIDLWLKNIPDLGKIKLDDYLNINNGKNDFPMISYDNYLSIFLERYGTSLDNCWFCTDKEGDAPKRRNVQHLSPDDLFDNFDDLLNKSQNQWIVNLDIDFFFRNGTNGDLIQRFSDLQIISLGKILKRSIEKGIITVITIALSPEWSGGWEQANRTNSILMKSMDIDFFIPF